MNTEEEFLKNWEEVDEVLKGPNARQFFHISKGLSNLELAFEYVEKVIESDDFGELDEDAKAKMFASRETLRTSLLQIQTITSSEEVTLKLIPRLRDMPVSTLSGRLGEDRSLTEEYDLKQTSEEFARSVAEEILHERRAADALTTAKWANRVAIMSAVFTGASLVLMWLALS